MPQERLSVRKTQEVLRLKWEVRLGNRAIARSCSISPTTVSEYIRRAHATGLRWPLPEMLDEDQLSRLLFPQPALSSERLIPEPDWKNVHRKLRRKGVTRRWLWLASHLRRRTSWILRMDNLSLGILTSSLGGKQGNRPPVPFMVLKPYHEETRNSEGEMMASSRRRLGKLKHPKQLEKVASWNSADGRDWFVLYETEEGYEYRGSTFRGTHEGIAVFRARYAQSDEETIAIVQAEIEQGGFRSGNTSLPMLLDTDKLQARRARLKEIHSVQERYRDMLALAYRVDEEWDSGISNPDWDADYPDPPRIIDDFCNLSQEECVRSSQPPLCCWLLTPGPDRRFGREASCHAHSHFIISNISPHIHKQHARLCATVVPFPSHWCQNREHFLTACRLRRRSAGHTTVDPVRGEAEELLDVQVHKNEPVVRCLL